MYITEIIMLNRKSLSLSLSLSLSTYIYIYINHFGYPHSIHVIIKLSNVEVGQYLDG